MSVKTDGFDSLAGAAVSSCYSSEEALCVPVVSTKRKEGHVSLSLLWGTKLLFLHSNTRWQYMIYSHVHKTNHQLDQQKLNVAEDTQDMRGNSEPGQPPRSHSAH